MLCRHLQGEREASCASCAVKSRCGVKDTSYLTPQATSQICAPEAVLTVGTAVKRPVVGDEVVVTISGNEFLRLAMLAYLLPSVTLAGTTCLSALAGLNDAETAILALIAFTVSFLPLWRRERTGTGLTTFAIEAPWQTCSKVDTESSFFKAPKNGNQT